MSWIVESRQSHSEEAILYRGKQPYGMLEDLVIPDVLLHPDSDERLWVPTVRDVGFRPLLLSVSQGYFVNLLWVSKSRHPLAPPARGTGPHHNSEGSLTLLGARVVGRGGRLLVRAAR